MLNSEEVDSYLIQIAVESNKKSIGKPKDKDLLHVKYI